MNSTYYLSIDVGSKKTGLAIYANATNCLHVLPVFTYSHFHGKSWFQQLQSALKAYWNQLDCIIIGWPTRITNAHILNEANKYVAQVFRMLQAWTNFPIHLVDENYSSVISEQLLKNHNFPPSYFQKYADSYAAAYFLSCYVQKHHQLEPLLVMK